MKRKISSILAVFAAIMFLLSTMTACGSNSMKTMSMDDSYSEEAASDFFATADVAAPMEAMENGSRAYSESSSSSSIQDEPEVEEDINTGNSNPIQKIIYNASLEMETTSDFFEESVTAISELTEQLGGYIADNSISDRGSSHRWATYTIRIPVNNFQMFLNQAGDICHETHRNVSREDVSEFYYDTDGRLKTQQVKLARLQALLEHAEDMADIITIESAIAETEYMIEDLSGTLRHYDDLVNYSTIQISLTEVYKLSNVGEIPDSFGSNIASAFVNGIRDFGGFLEDVFVAVAYSWLWLLIFGVIIFFIVRQIRRNTKKHREKINHAKLAWRASQNIQNVPQTINPMTAPEMENTGENENQSDENSTNHEDKKD